MIECSCVLTIIMAEELPCFLHMCLEGLRYMYEQKMATKTSGVCLAASDAYTMHHIPLFRLRNTAIKRLI